MSSKLQYHLNPLHVYCWMRDMGITKEMALFLCRIYESTIFQPFLAKKPN